MSDSARVDITHLHRRACVYVQQSTAQVAHDSASAERHGPLVEHAVALGWQRDQVTVIEENQVGVDDDLGETTGRLARLTSDVTLGHVGIVLGLEICQLVRRSGSWAWFVALCGATNTLVGDAERIYHPGLAEDRVALGITSTIFEAELHVVRARVAAGTRSKAERGELRRGLPVGFVWGAAEGEVRMHDDEAITAALHAVFDRFAQVGSARQVWLWMRAQGLKWPLQSTALRETTWVAPTYTKIHQVLTNPVYAGAYVYGKSRHEHYVDELGRVRKRTRLLPRAEWSVVIRDHHPGFIDWETFEANQARLAANIHPRRESTEGTARDGAALLQGLATCGRCGRALRAYYSGRNATARYHCAGAVIVNGKGRHCMRIRGMRIDEAVSHALFAEITPAGVEAALRAEKISPTKDRAGLAQWRSRAEPARADARRAERRYGAADREDRLVACDRETGWEGRRGPGETALATAQQPGALGDRERAMLRGLGDDLRKVWRASTTTHRDRKELLRTVLEEVSVTVDRAKQQAHLTLRWRGGAIRVLCVDLRRASKLPASARGSGVIERPDPAQEPT